MSNDREISPKSSADANADAAAGGADASPISPISHDAGRPRAPYAPPTLRHLGSVRQLTLGASGRRGDHLGGFRRSSQSVKEEIRYLDDGARRALADQVLALRLATYAYKPEAGEQPGRHLGFLIEDAPGAPFVTEDARHVDVYGFATALAAVVQEQARTIARLEAELAEVRTAVQSKA